MGFSTLPSPTTTTTSQTNTNTNTNTTTIFGSGSRNFAAAAGAGGTRNQCYAPNGPSANHHHHHFSASTTSTRNPNSGSFVNNVLSSMATTLSNSSHSATSTLLGHLRSWQRSRRLRALSKQQQQQQQLQQQQLQNNFQGSRVHPSMNNLCYQSMMLNNNNNNNNNLNKSCTDLYYRQSQPVAVTSGFTRNHYNRKKKKNGGGEIEILGGGGGGGGDAIAMQQLMVGGDRVLVNENQLYSMNHPNHPHHHHYHHHPHHQPLYRTLSDNCYVSLDPPEAVLTTSLDSSPAATTTTATSSSLEAEELNSELWYYGNIDRERATALVSRACTGSFLVRSSGTFSTSYALTVKVPADHSHTGVCHYLILRTEEDGGKFKIKGFTKEFDTVQSLIVHHTIMKEQLPCTLKLQQRPNSTTTNTTNSSTTTLGSKASAHFYNTVKSAHATPSSSSLYGNFYTYGKKGGEDAGCSSLQVGEDEEDHDLMVDVDLDPTYQQILDNFRKVMAQCS